MTAPYSQQNWVDGPTGGTPISAARLIHMENGISAANVVFNTMYNVQDPTYGAKGDGSTDDTTAIQAALNACPAGGVVYLPRGVYRTSAPINIPPYVTLRSSHGGGEAQSTNPAENSSIKPLSTFTGPAVVQILDQGLGGWSTLSSEQAVYDLTIDGSASPANVDGIRISGQVQLPRLRDVHVRSVTGIGINTTYNLNAPPGPQAPFCLHFDRVSVLWATSHGIALNNCTDSTFMDVYVLGCSGYGWYIAGSDNSTLVACRAEWSALDGFNLNAGNAAIALIGCSTDRNRQSGISIPSNTKTGPILLTGCHLKRDGSVSTTAGYAGLSVGAAASPVIADGLIITTGYNDDGSGNQSPQYGVSATGAAYVSVASGKLVGVSSAWNDGGSNTTFLRGPLTTGNGISSWTWPGTASNTSAAATSSALQTRVSGDANQRFNINADGKMGWGPGTAATDTNLYRDTTNALKTDSYFTMTGGQSSGNFTAYTSNPKALVAGVAGGGMAVKEGTNGRMGVATLAAGTVTVSTTNVTATTRIFLTSQTLGGTAGFLRVSAVTAGTSFTITSSSSSDTSTVAYLLVEPA